MTLYGNNPNGMVPVPRKAFAKALATIIMFVVLVAASLSLSQCDDWYRGWPSDAHDTVQVP
jgi:hypothetical protein